MSYQKLTDSLTEWLKEKVKEANCQGLVVGLSGGIDSAVVVALAKRAFPESCIGVVMPCHSNPEDAADANLVAEALQIPTKIVNLNSVFDSFLNVLNVQEEDLKTLTLYNIKPRLRMTTLYYWASKLNYLVAGTGNKSELTIGYFTKYGDGGVDLLPLANLVKKDVWGLADYLGIPEKIITKPPSAGLWENQTDEKEMCMTYKELDDYITTGNVDIAIKEKIEKMNRVSEHKRQMPAKPPIIK